MVTKTYINRRMGAALIVFIGFLMLMGAVVMQCILMRYKASVAMGCTGAIAIALGSVRFKLSVPRRFKPNF